ncbi:HAD-IC family P-type ATPase [Agromyces atrinae]|uniref:Cation-transporting ATPase E n=1 Tax=Agromyces atrinae TaxID=592376 RepID=A0A4Q2M111_9MICO|nr:HAD-IC family P-type ATPase [Agromyces atrinae]NYD66976.1 cation-transporting ATPase E [Agromyces atrinae]RXZ85290.1 HAD family hydrolase [Agromyces atrinae]RXZ85398.1 HAD family hydrolase [Agromyces atrinae]
MTETATATRGLTSAEVAERRADGRVNDFVAPTSRSIGSILRANVLTLFNAIVIGCFGVLLVLGRWQDALFGFAAISNALIGTIQEFRAKSALDKLALLDAPNARVWRDGELSEIRVVNVVLDETLELRAGDQVPADGLVAEASRLQVDESMLTGESEPVDKGPGDRVLSGSVVVAGRGTAVVDRVGADSFANKLASEAKRFSLIASELRGSIDRVLKWITWIIGPMALLVLNSQMVAQGGWAAAIESGRWQEAGVGTMASVIAMIPLGLVLMTSIAFAVGAVKLSGHKVLVQELPAVEVLARVDLICLDKTGTITTGDIRFDEAHPVSEVDGWQAVLAWNGAADDANATTQCLVTAYPVDDALPVAERIPFSSARKWSAVSFGGTPSMSTAGTWVLAAPEMVFDETSDRWGVVERAGELAASGRRTLVLAHTVVALDADDVEHERFRGDLVPVVLLTFREEVRPDAKETLEYFAEQGVAVRIISGDNPETVAAIARDVGLDVPHGVDARTLPTDVDELATVLAEHSVFGRVTPDQKKNIVVALKKAGHTVAMTGDGVNDALAIKEADIGIAMESGSAATKAVSRLVLLDGRFSRLPGVVAEGRQVIANIERVSMLFLTKTAYAVSLALVFGILLLEFPLLPRQFSVTDGLTIGIPAFFLALLPNAQKYVPGFLWRALSFSIPAGLIVAVCLTTLSLYGRNTGIDQSEVRTATTIVLGLIGIAVLAGLSWPFTIKKVLIVIGMIVGLAVVLYVPLSAQFFEFVPLSEPLIVMGSIIAGVGIVLVTILRIVHTIVLRRRAARHAPAPLV